ncbi:MAG: hypothetical protein JKY54_16865 [Flavobacteriales bacterium]|nr:hypothetical protein [Flavobacteriales bacterium]
MMEVLEQDYNILAPEVKITFDKEASEVSVGVSIYRAGKSPADISYSFKANRIGTACYQPLFRGFYDEHKIMRLTGEL